ncbi:putative alpha-1,6-mannosyltransferase MNN11 [Wickerhamiella sorbophila]|uniref:Putative alpha-1,6-mannosyltransferase MNN11 n=1 Tax=Wickerhamiella sorbophila TaxID=45607 RepID=A0A2T0FNX4_9ASCO|nr:putative alpha-1,6-mannosyltransferase MNN11 [Wickerhamiella sorbophila]PRT56692.1 putative alpha-1,6-mannosyltransferase MNN11 [Wickerhamiella sorbophila]
MSAGNRRRGTKETLPSYVVADEEEIGYQTPVKRSWRENLNAEVMREIAFVVFGLLILMWLFLGGSSSSESNASWAGRPLVYTQSEFIIPSIPGVAHQGIKKAPGDMNEVQSQGDTRNSQALGNLPVYVYSGSKSPKVVIVTVIDDARYPNEYTAKILENRLEYARAHDYGVFVRFTKDFLPIYKESNGRSPTWAQVGISREALEAFPNAKHFWYLDQTAIIMNPLVDIEKEFLDPAHLESKTLVNARVVRDSDVIKVLKNDPKSVDLIITRDDIGLSTLSYIFSNNYHVKAMFETWLEPLYRQYQHFRNSEDALLHMLQWHTIYISHTAVVSTKLLASQAEPADGPFRDELAYTDGDFTAVFNCDYNTEACKQLFQRLWKGRGRIRSKSDRN